jgi:hypothetical protein
MASPLENLVAQKQLKVEPFAQAEIDSLLKRAAGLLTDAGNKALGPASRFALAYDAAFTLATAALRMSGYRADISRGHRAIIFQVLPHTLNAPTELWTGLTAMHDRRNAVEYSAALAPTDAEVADLLSMSRKLDNMVRTRSGRKS